MPKQTRISLSVPRDLLSEFDDLTESVGHPNRSNAVAEAMRDYVSSKRWSMARKGVVPGVILITYDHHSRGITSALTTMQHDFTDVVTSTMHIHLTRHKCLEVIAFKGEAGRVRSLAKTLQSHRGVLDLKLVTAPQGP
jgi:CopG family nickel-responsive transcriptional regulator